MPVSSCLRTAPRLLPVRPLRFTAAGAAATRAGVAATAGGLRTHASACPDGKNPPSHLNDGLVGLHYVELIVRHYGTKSTCPCRSPDPQPCCGSVLKSNSSAFRTSARTATAAHPFELAHHRQVLLRVAEMKNLTGKHLVRNTTSTTQTATMPDGEPSDASITSGGAYLEREILPDIRRTHYDTRISGLNYSNTTGHMAVVKYTLKFNTPV